METPQRKDTESSYENNPETTKKIRELLRNQTNPEALPAELQDGKDWRPAPTAAEKRETNRNGLSRARMALEQAYKHTEQQ